MIRLLEPSDSISELTLLIRRAYKVLADLGFNYTGTFQDEAITRERIAEGECYVMVEQDRIVGTITLCIPPLHWGDSNWFRRPGVFAFGQFAVEPELQGAGRGAMLMDFVEERARQLGAVELALDTSEGAVHLVQFYSKRGYRFVEHIHYEEKTYRSVILSKEL